MPKGFKAIREAVAGIEARKAAAAEGGDKPEFTPSLWFKLPDSGLGVKPEDLAASQSAIIRPLEDGENVVFATVHPVKVPDKKYDVDIICRDQDNEGEPCPGCEMGLKRKFKGWINVIWRDAPDFPQDENGRYNQKVDYNSLPTSDKVAILSSGPILFGRLDELDEDLGGLTGYDFRITREGTGLATKYKVKKVKKSALSAADKALAENKPDLSNFIKIPDYDEWVARAQGNYSRSGDDDEAPAVPKSPFGGGKAATIFG